MKRHRCAVLSVVKHDYLPRGVASHPEFELAVVADDPDVPDWAHARNRLFAEEHSIPYVTDIEQAIAAHQVQVAVVSSEAERHSDLTLRAVTAGLHVVQDKPLATRLQDCDRIVEAVRQANVRLLMWNRSCMPALVQARDLVEAGAIGDVLSIHTDFYFSKDAGPPKGSRGPGDPPIEWLERQLEAHADGSDGGLGREPLGELAVEGCYPLACLRMLTGAEVRHVFARAATHFHQAHEDNHVEDLATVTLRMDKGVLASLSVGRIPAASHPDLGEIKLHVLGTQGGLVVNESRPEVAVYYRGQPPQEFRHQRVGDDNDYLLMENFARAIETGQPTMLDAKAGRAIAATVEAALESASTHRLVAVSA